MTLLHIIVVTTLVMTLTAIWAMAMLILFRAVRNFERERKQQSKDTLVPIVLESLDDSAAYQNHKTLLSAASRTLLLEIFIDLRIKVEGDYVTRMTQIMRELGVVDEALRQLRSPFAVTRASGCNTLEFFPEPKAVEALRERLEDRNQIVRLSAARALVKLGAPLSAEEILDRLCPKSSDISLAINDLFRSLGPEAIPDLMRVMESDRPVSVRVLAMDALGQMGRPELAPGLASMLKDKSTAIRVQAIKSLNHVNDPRVVPPMIAALSDSSWEVRAEAAVCAGLLGADEALPVLEAGLRDEFWWVRFRSAEALFKLGPPGVAALQSAAARGATRDGDIARGFLREKGLAA